MSQFFAITGKRPRQRRAEEVLMEAEYTPEIHRMRDEKAYNEKMHGLNLKGLEQNQDVINWQKEQAEDEKDRRILDFRRKKKADDKAKKIKYLDLASNVLLGSGQDSTGQGSGWIDSTLDLATSGVKKVYGAAKDSISSLYGGVGSLISEIFS